MNTTRFTITGCVQGVGYRASTFIKARQYGVRGWVRNRQDGSVEAVCQGLAADLDRLEAWFRRGPPGASVSQVLAEPVATAEVFSGFEQRSTA